MKDPNGHVHLTERGSPRSNPQSTRRLPMLYPYFWRLLPLPTQILIDCNLPIELEGTQELFRTHDSETTCELLHDRAHLIRKQNQLPEVFKTVMQNATKRIILITGCDSGFGALSAIALSSSGYRVVSACLTEDGAERLRAEVALAVVCDVTKEKDISRLTSIIAKLASDENLFLWAVINNAGVAPIGYMEWISMESVKKAMDVNYFGMISVIKAMLPLLKKTKGSRIINISSSAGLGGGAALGAYAGVSY